MKTDLFYQTQNIEYIKNNYGKEQWVQVSGNRDMNGAKASFWCGLVKNDHINDVFRNLSWDISFSSGYPGFTEFGDNVLYQRNTSRENFEPLLFGREFYGVRDDYVEISEEFRLLNNLYYEKSNGIYYEILDNGETAEVIRTKGNKTVCINLKYLKRFAAAKQMAVLLFFDIKVNIQGTLKENNHNECDETYKDDSLFYSFCTGDNILRNNCFSRLMGKKILFPQEIETCGYWPYENKKEYLEFIIKADPNGDPVTFTSNPDQLADYFGSNPEAPHYLTPVFFKREVLDKYLKHQELYKVTDGRLTCSGLWSIKISNHYKSHVSVFLGDLGAYLPEQEQIHWKSYNVLCDERLSKTAVLRDFFNIPAEPEIIDLKFKRDYLLLQRKWSDHFGWQFFKELSKEDQYNFDNIRIPSSESQEEFDHLVLSLVKSIIDSINEEKLILQDTLKDDGSKIRGISKLEKWFEEQHISVYERHIRFLRAIQELRSSGIGHRKGKNYQKVCDKFDIGSKPMIDVFEEILNDADDFILFLMKCTEQ